jgi:hypothetical protein
MSAFASFLGAVGGPTTAAALVAGGLVAGVIGGGVLAGAASGDRPGGGAPAAGTLPVYPCPNAGPALATVQGGQRLLVTGRTEDGAWLRIHLPEPGRTEGWVQANPLTVKGDVTSLPVAECLPELAVVAPGVAPEPSLTATVAIQPTPTPTPTPTPPTATPTPTPAAATPTPTPANKAPGLASLRVSTSRISYDTANYCPNAATSVTFRVTATDDAGVAGVTLFWRKPGSNGFAQARMTRSGGSAKDATWQVTLDTGTNDITTAGKLAYYAVATDTAGKTRRIPANGSNTITVAVCENTGPAITSVASSSGKSLYWDPLSVGRCQTATNITATVKDVDGVKSVTLFYRKPGSSTWQSKPMSNTVVRGKWYANLDTLGDKITIPNPPTGSLRWYIKAVDDKGKSSQTSTLGTTIRRCDTEASFKPNGASCSGNVMTFITYATDRDQAAGLLKVVFYYSLTSVRPPGTLDGKKAWTNHDGNYYLTSITVDTSKIGFGSGQYWAVTTDMYGGTSKSPVTSFSFQCSG